MVTITGQYRDNGRFYVASSIDLDFRVKTWGTVEPDPQFGMFATERTAQRIIDRLVKVQEKSGDIDWTDLSIEEAA